MFLWIIRHCESQGNVDISTYTKMSNMEIGLSERGVEQARKLGQIITSHFAIAPKAIICSPYVRAKQTAQIMLENMHLRVDVPIWEDMLLSEQLYGAATGCGSIDEFLSKNPSQVPLRNNLGHFMYPFPQGESLAAVLARAETFLNKLFRLTSTGKPSDSFVSCMTSYIVVAHKNFCSMLEQALTTKYTSEQEDLMWMNGEARIYNLEYNLAFKEKIVVDSTKSL